MPLNSRLSISRPMACEALRWEILAIAGGQEDEPLYL